MPASRRGATSRTEALALPVRDVEHGPTDVHRVGVDMVMLVQVRAGDLNSRAVALERSRVAGKHGGVSIIRLAIGEKVMSGEMVGKLVGKLGHRLLIVQRRVLMSDWGSLIGTVAGGEAGVIN